MILNMVNAIKTKGIYVKNKTIISEDIDHTIKIIEKQNLASN